MKYAITLSPKAARQFKKLQLPAKKRIGMHIDRLASNPRPMSNKKLAGNKSLYRLRVGDYRIIYEVEDKKLSILVLTIVDRKVVCTKRFN